MVQSCGSVRVRERQPVHVCARDTAELHLAEDKRMARLCSRNGQQQFSVLPALCECATELS